MVQICLMPLVLREVWGTLGEPRLPQLCAEGHRGGVGGIHQPREEEPHTPPDPGRDALLSGVQ